jgi:hypothetical protein
MASWLTAHRTGDTNFDKMHNSRRNRTARCWRDTSPGAAHLQPRLRNAPLNGTARLPQSTQACSWSTSSSRAPLISGCGDHQNRAMSGMIERLVQLTFAGRRRVSERGAQIDDVYACADRVVNGARKLRGSGAGHGAAAICVLRKNGAQEESAVRTDRGCGATATNNEHPRNKGPVHTSHTVQAGTGAVNRSRKFLDSRLVQIGMTEGERTINQSHPHVAPSLAP